MKRKSTRFEPSKMVEIITPVLLGLLVVGLLAVLVIIGLSVMGVFPAG